MWIVLLALALIFHKFVLRIFFGMVVVKEAEGNAKSKTINAEADAKVISIIGEAEASKTESVGKAEATVIEQKIKSMDAGNYAAVQIANALASNKIALVPQIQVGGGGTSGGGSLVDVLLANLVRDSINKQSDNAKPAKQPVAG